MNDIFIECDCHAELLRVEKQDDKEYWFSFWQSGFGNKKFTIKDVLKIIFYVIKNRSVPHTDMIILNKEKINKLVAFLKEDK